MARKRKKDQVSEVLTERLLSARYRFGEEIAVKELGEELGLSRQPIMTALYRLAADGFVQIEPQVGCVVVSPTPKQMMDFFLMFARLEGLACELAAQRRADADIEALQLVNARMIGIDVEAEAAGQEYRLLNRQFHLALYESAHSDPVREQQKRLLLMSEFLISQTAGFAIRMREAISEHDVIIDAIATGDAKLARKSAEKHALSSHDEVSAAYRRLRAGAKAPRRP